MFFHDDTEVDAKGKFHSKYDFKLFNLIAKKKKLKI